MTTPTGPAGSPTGTPHSRCEPLGGAQRQGPTTHRIRRPGLQQRPSRFRQGPGRRPKLSSIRQTSDHGLSRRTEVVARLTRSEQQHPVSPTNAAPRNATHRRAARARTGRSHHHALRLVPVGRVGRLSGLRAPSRTYVLRDAAAQIEIERLLLESSVYRGPGRQPAGDLDAAIQGSVVCRELADGAPLQRRLRVDLLTRPRSHLPRQA
jgi:hypothetical protein